MSSMYDGLCKDSTSKFMEADHAERVGRREVMEFARSFGFLEVHGLVSGVADSRWQDTKTTECMVQEAW